MRRSAWLAVLAGAAVILLGAMAWWRPFVVDKRQFVASIPQPSPLFSAPLIPLAGGERLCFAPAVMDTRSEQATFLVKPRGRRGEPLRLALDGPGYRFAAGVPGGYRGDTVMNVPVPAPARDVALRICLENAGRRGVYVHGAEDRTLTPLTVTRDGTTISINPVFVFFESKPRSLLAHLPVAFERMAQFRPGFVRTWLIWALTLIAVAAVPAGALWALWSAVRQDAADELRDDAPEPVGATAEHAWDRASAI